MHLPPAPEEIKPVQRPSIVGGQRLEFDAQHRVPGFQAGQFLLRPVARLSKDHRPRGDQRRQLLDVELLQQAEAVRLGRLIDRAVSLDSRQTGAVAISAVVGRVLTRVWRT